MDLLLGPDGDLVLTKNDFQLATGIAAVEQACTIRVRTLAGEWFLDPTLGLLDLENLDEQILNEDLFKAQIRLALATCPGLISLDTITLSRDQTLASPTLSVTLVGKADAGPLNLTVPNILGPT